MNDNLSSPKPGTVRQTLDYSVWIAVALLVAVLVVNAGLGYRNTRQLHEDARGVAHTHEVLDLSGDTLGALVDAESGVRGFVITGKEEFLQDYEAALPTFGRVFRKLKDESKDNPAQQARLQKLEEMAALRLGLFQEAIALRRQSAEDAAALIATGKGKAQMDAIRLLVQELEEVETDMLRDRQRENARAYDVAVATGLLAAALGLAMIGAFVLLLHRSQRARGKVAADLMVSEERFRGILRQSPAGIIQTDATGCMTLVNERWCEMLGYSEAELLGKSLLDITHSSSVTATGENVARLAAGGPDFQTEKNYLRKDGSVVPAQSNVRALRSPDGKFLGLVAVVVDLSERQRGDQQLRERAGQLDLLARSAQRLFECPSLTPEVREEIFGSIGELIGVESYYHYRADNAERCLFLDASGGASEEARRIFGTMKFGEMLCGRVAESGKRLIVEDLSRSTQPGSEALRAAGAQSYAGFPLLNSRGELVGTLAFISAKRTHFREGDVQMIETICAQVALMMERERAEEAVARLAAIVESSHDALFGEDLDGIITSWNPGAEQIFGYRAEEIVGTSIMRLIPADRQAAEHEVQRQIVAGELGGTFEAIRLTKEGREFPASITVAPMKDAAGRVIGTSTVLRDITERKRAEEALLASETRFRTAVGIVSSIVWTNNAQGMMTDEQPGWANFTGQTLEEYQGYGWAKALHPDDAQPTIDAWNQAVAEKRTFEFQHRVRRHDGEWRLCSIRAIPLLRDDGTISEWIGVHTDITERKRAEEALRENAAVFSTLIAQAPMGTYVLDAQLRMRQINAHALPAFGSVHPLIGRDFQEVVEILWGPEVGGPIIRVFRNTLATGERYISPPFTEKRHDLGIEQTYEWETQRVTLPDGQHGVVCYFHEVTERAQATEALRASQERMSLAAEATGVGIWEWNVLTNTIRWDALMFRIYGIAPTPDGFVQYRDWSGAVLPEDLAETEAILQDTVRRAGQSSREFRIRRRSGGECRHIQAVETVRKNAAGQTEWVVGTNLDITEGKEAGLALRAAKEAAEAANAAKDRFLAVLSHELRTPLTPVLMTVSALEHDPDLRADIREDLVMIKRNIELETKLIDDLLDVSRIASGKVALKTEPLELNAVVRHVCESTRQQAKEQGVRLELELAHDTGFVTADSARLQQVVWNVVRNALKFTPEGGSIYIGTARREGRCEIKVRDTGIGIAPEMSARIFEAFEQGGLSITRQFGGLGLGLAISKALIELHRGTIRVESDGLGKGATFILELPAHAAAATPASTSTAPAAAHGPDLIRVLLVEDHTDTARALAQLLEREGFAVTLARNVATGLAAVEREPFDVIVSDLGLPDGSGLDLIRSAQKIRAIPGIAISGYGMDEDLRRSHEAGFSEHLVKPIKVPQLVEAIQRAAGDRVR